MGVVYRAFDKRLERWVAIKQVLPEVGSSNARERLRREARSAARLNHPSIVQVYDILDDGESVWVVMELLEGRTLYQLVRAGELELVQALEIARQIAAGLAEAHARGVVHRDLKTENVMVTSSGRVKVLDFGLAKRIEVSGEDGAVADSDRSATGKIVGTSRAMSPEQAMGDPVDERSDLFSLGSLLFETFAGQPPFKSSSYILTLAQVCTFDPPAVHRLNPKVPLQLSHLIGELLAKDPARRPRGAAEVAATLETLVRRAGRVPGRLYDGVDLTPLARSSKLFNDGGPQPSSVQSGSSTSITIQALVAAEVEVGEAPAEDTAAVDELLHELLSSYGGLAVPGPGPRLLVFRRPADAVRYAAVCRERLAALAAERGLEVAARFGVDLGEVFVEEEDGDSTAELEDPDRRRAVLLMTMARDFQVLASRVVCELARRSLAEDAELAARLRWVAHGVYLFEELAKEVAVFEVVMDDAASPGPPIVPPGVAWVGEGEGTGRARARRRFLAGAVTMTLLALGWWGWRTAVAPPLVAVATFEDRSSPAARGELSARLERELAAALEAGGAVRVATAGEAANAEWRAVGSYEVEVVDGREWLVVMPRLESKGGKDCAGEAASGWSPEELDAVAARAARGLLRCLD